MPLPPQTTCPECRIQFSKVSNLRAHVKRKHPEKLAEICPLKEYNGVEICTQCNKRFVNKSNLYSHLKTIHKADQGSVTEETVPLSTANMLSCVLCTYKSASKKQIMTHFQNNHDIKIHIQDLEFSDFEEFERWKYQMEEDSKTSYIKLHGSYETTNDAKIRYSCHRSGQVRLIGTRKRHLKTQGSKKINGYCPASINVTIEQNKKCKCTFIDTHVGHNQDLGHLFLTKAERRNIAAKIASKIPFQNILDSIRDSVSNSNLERLHLLKKKDLYNIERCFNLNRDSVRHTQDAVSVDSWVHDMTSSVLFYKPQDCISENCAFLKKEDFVLIIMTQGQIDLLKTFGSDTICIDGTHGLNGYGFEMHTLLILDDIREGYPCAFLISNRADEDVMKLFFNKVKQTLGETIRSKVFMSDMAEVYYNAWMQVMEPSEMRLSGVQVFLDI